MTKPSNGEQRRGATRQGVAPDRAAMLTTRLEVPAGMIDGLHLLDVSETGLAFKGPTAVPVGTVGRLTVTGGGALGGRAELEIEIRWVRPLGSGAVLHGARRRRQLSGDLDAMLRTLAAQRTPSEATE
ncbi:MAG TPA: PilZ domain-containing protein [Thermodesulfobacteriota bacterium]|nr:PilZ domain-containing protein [Thermodesulfobacteriota bacterium]